MPKGASSSEDTVRACRSPSTVLNPAIFDDDAFFSAAWRLNSDFGNVRFPFTNTDHKFASLHFAPSCALQRSP